MWFIFNGQWPSSNRGVLWTKTNNFCFTTFGNSTKKISASFKIFKYDLATEYESPCLDWIIPAFDNDYSLANSFIWFSAKWCGLNLSKRMHRRQNIDIIFGIIKTSLHLINEHRELANSHSQNTSYFVLMHLKLVQLMTTISFYCKTFGHILYTTHQRHMYFLKRNKRLRLSNFKNRTKHKRTAAWISILIHVLIMHWKKHQHCVLVQ